MSERKEPSRNITLRGVIAWLVRSGVASGVAVGIVYAIMQVGVIYRDVTLQREQLSAHEESQRADMVRIAEKNAAQDEKLAEHKETQVRILAILEQQGRELKRLDEQNQKALVRLENKVDRMDDFLRNFLRDGKDSAGLDEEASARNVSASPCIRHRKFIAENRAAL